MVGIKPPSNSDDRSLGHSFNLMLLKEAHSVEKLTRITVLLAKATMMLLA